MNSHTLSRRRLLSGTFLAFGTAQLAACGGGTEEDAAATASTEEGRANALRLSRVPPPAPGTSKIKDPGPGPTVGNVFTSLVVGTVEATGPAAYAATVMPLQGQVPANTTLGSPDDLGLSAAVLSRWPDGSAAVLVVGGVVQAPTAGQALRIGTRSATGVAAPLTAARVGQIVNSVQVAFGSLGTVSLTQFGNPERIWWAHGQSICARYRLRAPGHATLEAVVDIQAFAVDAALVEVVVENSLMDSANPVRPASAAYTAEVSVNNRSIGTARSSDAPEGVHSAFRAWHASTWVGSHGRVQATQLNTDLQKHPLLFRVDQPGGDMSVYAQDRYQPWSPVRQRPFNMGGTGDYAAIGPLPMWDSHFLQSGSPLASQSVQANALAILGFNVAYRDSVTGLVPNAEQLVGKDRHANWPITTNPEDRLCWETAHHPAAGLMAFVCRPSPIFIEVAQRIVVMNATFSAGGVGGQNLGSWSGTGITDSTGVYGFWYQVRGRAWSIRSLVHATFLSPDQTDWRSGGRYWLNLNRIYLSEWMRKPASNALNVFWSGGPEKLENQGVGPWQLPFWQNHFLITELHKAASARLLAGSQQSEFDRLADWAAMLPVRWVNEQPEGGWRYITYLQRVTPTFDPNAAFPSNWGAIMRNWVFTLPYNVVGPLSVYDGPNTQYHLIPPDGSAGGFYPSHWWAALAAAVERNVPGAELAWRTVLAQTTNLRTWRAGFSRDPRWGAWPRNIEWANPVPPAEPPPPPPVNLGPLELSDEQAQWYLTELREEFAQYGVPQTIAFAKQHWRDYGRPQGRKWAADAPPPAWGPRLI